MHKNIDEAGFYALAETLMSRSTPLVQIKLAAESGSDFTDFSKFVLGLLSSEHFSSIMLMHLLTYTWSFP